MATPWTSGAPSAWTTALSAQAVAPGSDGEGMSIAAVPDPSLAALPQAERIFMPALDLTDFQEIRFWFRSDRAGDGSPGTPFYLAFEAAADPGVVAPWSRFLPISRADTWELHRLWLGDMPAPLMSGVGVLRLRGLDKSTAFNAALDDILAVTPEPISDVEAAWAARLDGTLSVEAGGVATPVPLFLEAPDGPQAGPYILLTAWAVLPRQDMGSAVPVTDNYGAAGVYVRPAPGTIRLDYRLLVVAADRGQRAIALGALAAELQRAPYLMVAGEQIAIEPFEPAPQERAVLVPPDTTPLFYRLRQSLETGPRLFAPLARPLLTVGPLGGLDTAEAVPV